MLKKLLFIAACCTLSTAAYAQPVNVNQADAKTIAKALKGIGIKKAQRIVDHCQKQRACRKPEDLLAIKGIGPKTLKAIRQDLRFGKPSAKPVEKAAKADRSADKKPVRTATSRTAANHTVHK